MNAHILLTRLWRRILGVALAAVFVSSCAGLQNTPAGSAASFTDPFAYCAAVGTVDTPDAPYVGPKLPPEIIKGLMKLQLISPQAPAEIAEHVVWRCSGGKVVVCHFGNNIPCTTKADTGRNPTPRMEEFCKQNPAADVIPAFVTGRATVYEWRCKNARPEIVKEVFKPDEQGFLSAFWYEVRPE